MGGGPGSGVSVTEPTEFSAGATDSSGDGEAKLPSPGATLEPDLPVTEPPGPPELQVEG